ncbi:MAG: hypothetical protein HY761_10540 [Candidatus Omnitrophica bacterium]|nr:hypothetical protein [Candidatus Omnitrophota bacterium]
MIDNASIFSWSKRNNHLETSIGEELCDILHVIKSQAADLREPQSFADSFWREVIHELMYLFDAAAVAVRLNDGLNDGFEKTSMLLSEYQVIENLFIKNNTKRLDNGITMVHINGSKLGQLDISEWSEQDWYKQTVQPLLSIFDVEFSNIEAVYDSALKFVKKNQEQYEDVRKRLPLVDRRLLSISEKFVIPLVKDENEVGEIHIYLDKDSNQKMQFWLLNDKQAKEFFQIIYQLFTAKLHISDATNQNDETLRQWKILDQLKDFFEESKKFLDENGNLRDIDGFMNDFVAYFPHISRACDSICHIAEENFVKALKESELEEKNHKLAMVLGQPDEQNPKDLVYSYLFPLKHIESRLRNVLPFTDLKKVYTKPWHAHTSFTGYAMQTGVASYTADGDKDIRTSYESETIEAERKVLGLDPGENLQTVFVIPVVYKNSEQGGKSLPWAVLALFIEFPLPVKLKRKMFRIAQRHRERFAEAMRAQDFHWSTYRPERLEKERWIGIVASLTHPFRSATSAIEVYTRVILRFLEHCKNDMDESTRNRIIDKLKQSTGISYPEGIKNIITYLEDVRGVNKSQSQFFEALGRFVRGELTDWKDFEKQTSLESYVHDIDNSVTGRYIAEPPIAPQWLVNLNIAPISHWRSFRVIEEPIFKFIIYELITNARKFCSGAEEIAVQVMVNQTGVTFKFTNDINIGKTYLNNKCKICRETTFCCDVDKTELSPEIICLKCYNKTRLNNLKERWKELGRGLFFVKFFAEHGQLYSGKADNDAPEIYTRKCGKQQGIRLHFWFNIPFKEGICELL